MYMCFLSSAVPNILAVVVLQRDTLGEDQGKMVQGNGSSKIECKWTKKKNIGKGVTSGDWFGKLRDLKKS